MQQHIELIQAGLFSPETFETVTVSTSAVGFTASNLKVKSANTFKQATRAVITCEDNSFRYRYDGTNPTSSVGHLVTAGSVIILVGIQAIENFKAIRVSADAVLQVTFEF